MEEVKQRKPRKKAKPRSGPESGKDQRQARYGEKNSFWQMYRTPEGRAKLELWRLKKKLNGTAGRKTGLPDGYRWEEFKPLKEKAEREAKEIVKIMTEKFNIEDQYAKEALECAVEIMRTPQSVRDRLSAAKLVLDFTKEKPSTKAEVTVQKAEDFLAAIAGDLGFDKE